MKKSSLCFSFFAGIAFLVALAVPSAAADGKLEIEEQAITRQNTGTDDSGQAPARTKISGLLLPSRQEKAEAIERREREALERLREGKFLAWEVQNTVRAKKPGILATERKPQNSSAAAAGVFEEDGVPAALPSWMLSVPILLILAAACAAGCLLGKKYARIFRVKK